MDEAGTLGKVLEQLAASGPLAGVLGYACWRLWRAYQEALAGWRDSEQKHTRWLQEKFGCGPKGDS